MKLLLHLLVWGMLVFAVSVNAQEVNIITDSTDVFISSGGRLVLSSEVTNRGMNRWAYLNFAVSNTNVYNFDDSIATIAGASVDSTSAGRKADYVLSFISSPAAGTLGSSGAGSTIQLRMTVYLWRNLRGVLVAYRLKNTGSTPVTGRISYELYPRIDQVYTGHSLRWRSQDSVAFYFRTGLAHYLGAKYLSGRPSGVRLSSGTAFYVNGTVAEMQPDSVRWRAANYTSYDAAVDSGTTPRSMIHLNANQITLNANDSSSVYYYAMAYHTTEAGMIAALNAVRTRYISSFTSVEPVDATVPERFSLGQNYPNPFNPSTNIKYQIPSTNHVTLKVYDVLGREVATLINESKVAGKYSVQFDASPLPSGVYFYTLKSGAFTETKRMLLLK